MAGGRKKRFWSDDEKRSICRQSKVAGVSVAQVARRYAMNANLIFKWLKDDRFLQDTSVGSAVFLPVELEAHPEPGLHSFPAPSPSGRMEIVLAAGHRVTVEGEYDGDALARLLKGLTT